MERTEEAQMVQAQLLAYELTLAMLVGNATTDQLRLAVAQMDVTMENVPATLPQHLESIFLKQLGSLRAALIHGIQ